MSVDELFRIAEAARLHDCVPGDVLAEAGTPARRVIFLLAGTITVSSTGSASAAGTPLDAPAAVLVEDVLQGRPAAHAVVMTAPGTCLTLPAAMFLTMVTEAPAIARGLFRLLLDSPDADLWTEQHRPPTTDAPARPRGAADPVETVLLLRQIPLLGEAGVDHLRDLVAVTREVSLRAGRNLFAAEAAPAVYHVRRGDLQVQTADGTTVTIGPGSTIGLGQTLAGTPPLRSATAVTDVRVLRIDAEDLFDVLADHPDLLQHVFRALQRARGEES